LEEQITIGAGRNLPTQQNRRDRRQLLHVRTGRVDPQDDDEKRFSKI